MFYGIRAKGELCVLLGEASGGQKIQKHLIALVYSQAAVGDYIPQSQFYDVADCVYKVNSII